MKLHNKTMLPEQSNFYRADFGLAWSGLGHPNSADSKNFE
jgi:hypothetical protein